MENKILTRLFLLVIFIISIHALRNPKNSVEKDPLTPLELQKFDRLSSPVLSPDGKYVVYTVKKWNETSLKSYTNLQLTVMDTKERGFITPAVPDQTDSNPTFSVDFPNYLFFQRNGKIIYSISSR